MRARLLVPLLCFVATTAAAQTSGFFYSDKISDLAGSWVLDPARGVGGICGVSVEARLKFDVAPDAVTIVEGRFTGRIPFNQPITPLVGQQRLASTDAGWLKLTVTTERSGGFANIMQDVFILNRDRNELTVWRTLNVRRPDGQPDKIDCGNHVVMVYRRQPSN